MYRLAERLHYRHVEDLLQEMHAGELTGWFEYLKIDDEVRAGWMTYAILKAFQRPQAGETAEDDEIIDTTTSDFAQNFQGFITN